MSEIDPETKSLQDAIFLSKVARARWTPIGEKIMEGPRLFDLTCQRMRDGIRHEFPAYDEHQVETFLQCKPGLVPCCCWLRAKPASRINRGVMSHC